ncbi:MAG: metallophosphoesterase [Lentisphaerae bacterium]|nr:metallophosphoesterase [Lentisphaerota bacterium]
MKLKLCLAVFALIPDLLCAEVSIGKWRAVFAPKAELTADCARRASMQGILPEGAVEFKLNGNYRNLRDLCAKGKFGKEEAALVHTALSVPEKCKVNIGTSCDWYMTVFCNGRMIMTNEPLGSAYSSHTPVDYQLPLELNPGLNHLTFLLRPGTASWDFAFALAPSTEYWPSDNDGRRAFFQRLFPAAARTFHIFPYLSSITQKSAQVSMEFSDEEAVQLRYRKAGRKKWEIVPAERREGLIRRKKQHHLQLNNLVPGTRYECVIEILAQDAGPQAVEVQKLCFNTLPSKGLDHSVLFIGDTQVRPYACRESVEAALKFAQNPAMLIHLGDVQHQISDPIRDFFRNIVDVVNCGYPEKLKSDPGHALLPVLLVRGNHDFRGKYSEYFTEYFQKAYRAFRAGEVFYIILDAGEMIPASRTKTSVTYYNDFTEYFKQQRKWLDKVIASPECRSAKRRIVISHATPFANAKHYRSCLEKITGNAFFGENPRCKIDLWVAGHVHLAHRYHPADKSLYGVDTPKLKALASPEKNCFKGVNFPVYVNDGPGDLIKLSSIELKHDNSGMEIICRDLTSGKILDHVRLSDGKPFAVKETTFVKY